MSGLITLRWLIDDEEIRSETVPHDLKAIESLERSVNVTAFGEHKLTVRMEFDPPVSCPPARATQPRST